jgi:uncharacterized protein YcbX
VTTGRLARIYRHPVKGIGSEALEAAALSPRGALAGDRAWALLTAAAPDGDGWQPRRNFLQVASGPGLAAVTARSEGEAVVLSHPDRPDFRLTGASDGPALGAWIGALWPAGRPAPARLLRAPGHGMTDMPDPFVSLGNLSSLRALSQRAGRDLDPRRFRINLWIDGLAPWEEFDLAGRGLSLGAATLAVAARIGRCRAPEADPATGRRDVDVCRVLDEGWGHTDFGVYCRVTEGATVRRGDALAAA